MTEDKKFEQGIDFEVTDITVTFGLTLNLENYESARVDQGMTARLVREMTEEEVKKLTKQLNNTVRKRVINEVRKVYNVPEIVREKL